MTTVAIASRRPGLAQARVASIVVGAASILLLIGAWEAVGRLPDSALSAVMPPPSQFLSAVADSGFRVGLGAQAVSVYQAVFSTLFRVFSGMAVAYVLAIMTGAIISLSRLAEWTLSPILNLLAPIAPIAWVPVAIVLFGIGNLTAIFVVFMGVYFSLTIATLAEIRRIPEQFRTVARNLGATRFQEWRHVMFPAVLPGVFTLLRINFIAAWMSVLVAEMVGLRDGIGAIIMMGRNLFNAELIMFGMLVIGICGFVIDRLLGQIQRRLLWWST
jgi:NitT/TauT family transport system permease protein